MIRALSTLFTLFAFSSLAQAACLSALESKPQDWYAWARVLVAGDVTRVSQQGRYDVVALHVVEAFKGPELVETMTLEVPSNHWQACKVGRPKAGDRVLAALSATNEANLIPLDAAHADQLRAARPADAIVAAPVPKPAAAPVAAAAAAAPENGAPIAMRCVRSPVYGATVKVESCEESGGALFMRGVIVRAAQENYADAVEGLPIPEPGRKFSFFKPKGQCTDYSKISSFTGRLSSPCCDANQPYCKRKTDFLVDEGTGATPPR